MFFEQAIERARRIRIEEWKFIIDVHTCYCSCSMSANYQDDLTKLLSKQQRKD